jgi:hypothetical protein
VKNAQRGRRYPLLFEEKIEEKCRGPLVLNPIMRYEKEEISQKTPVSPLLPRFCGELL